MNIAFVQKTLQKKPLHSNSISSHQFRKWANFELFWIHGEISTVNGEHFIADIITMSSSRKFARDDKKNYAFFIPYSLKFSKILRTPRPRPPPAPIKIWEIFQPTLLFQPLRLTIFGTFFNPPPLLFQPPPPSISYQRVLVLGYLGY